MRRARTTLASLALLALLPLAAACGDDTGDGPADGGADPTASDTASPSDDLTPSDPPDATSSSGTGEPAVALPEVVGLLHETAVGGEGDETLVEVDDPAALEQFVGQFSRRAGFSETVRAGVEDAATRGTAYAAVVGLGCDVPPGVEITPSGDGFAVQAQKVANPLPNCLAPVTTVVVAVVPD
ncbi:hypothetical protein GCM10023340_16080 [Nocardioides marinquilinus]|uniref:Lipoprotein n=1 Tax=Nocardioides marinquilinus TaxID=1210400 RepID=A0ABP9PFU4_9ACTN